MIVKKNCEKSKLFFRENMWCAAHIVYKWPHLFWQVEVHAIPIPESEFVRLWELDTVSFETSDWGTCLHACKNWGILSSNPDWCNPNLDLKIRKTVKFRKGISYFDEKKLRINYYNRATKLHLCSQCNLTEK